MSSSGGHRCERISSTPRFRSRTQTAKGPGEVVASPGPPRPNGKGGLLTLFGNAPHKSGSRYLVPDKGNEKPRRSGANSALPDEEDL